LVPPGESPGTVDLSGVFLYRESKELFYSNPIMRKLGDLDLSSEFILFLQPIMESSFRNDMNDGQLEQHIIFTLRFIIGIALLQSCIYLVNKRIRI
jgi:hypothetical protein